jgi:hypothetical protein
MKLIRLAMTDMYVKYARSMGGNQIRHYSIPYSTALLHNPDDVVKNYVSKETGIDPSQIEIVSQQVSHKFDSNGVLQTIPAPEVLNDCEVIEKELLKLEAKSIICDFKEKLPLKSKVWNLFAKTCNFFISKIANLFGNSCPRLLNKVEPKAHYEICKFLSLSFEEQDARKAYELLRNDLKKLSDYGVILGHLAMPFVYQAADIIGSGNNTFILACFPFIDTQKLAHLLNLSVDELAKPLSLREHLGLETECSEAMSSITSLDPKMKYQIEEVKIGYEEQLQAKQAYIDSYKELQEHKEWLDSEKAKLDKDSPSKE